MKRPSDHLPLAKSSPAKKTTTGFEVIHLPAMFKFTLALTVLLQVPFLVNSQLYNGGLIRNEITSDLIDYEP